MTKAAKAIAKNSKESMLYSLDFMTEMFIQLSHKSPFLTLQWCYILKLMNHSPQSLWHKVLQPEQHSSIGEVHPSNNESDCLHYEVLRKGSLILLCDFLCENISNVEYTTWVIVNYTQNLVHSINESPVQDFVMSVHRSSSSSGLLLQAVISRLSTIGHSAKVAFLKDALNVIENVHKSFAGKLVHCLVHKYLVGPHLSLTRQANFIACTRVEAMINTDKMEVLNLFKSEELAGILETLKKHKLTKRFGRLFTLLNRIATDVFDLSPITGQDHDRTFNPGSVSTVKLDRDWLLGQIRVRCCHPDNLTASSSVSNGKVCAKILSHLESETEILEIMTLQDFSLSLLSCCLLFDNKGPLFDASKKVLLSHIKTITETALPKPFGFFRPSFWPLTSNDSRYTEWLENVFHSPDFQRNLAYLMSAVQAAFENKAFADLQDEAELMALTRFSVVLVTEYCKWINCDLRDEKIDQGREETSSLCLKVVALALSHKRIADFLCQDFPPR